MRITTHDYSFELKEGESLLDALARTGHEVEYQCRAGYCGSCRVKLLSGSVDYADLPLAGGATAVGDAASDIQQALMALGYNEKDAAAALKALPAGVGVSEGIKLALKSLAK